MRRLLIATTPFIMLALGAQAQTTPSILVENAWARATTASAQAAAIYVTVTDQGTPDRLVGVSTPVAGQAAVHETIHEGNVMKMRPVAGLAISASTPISLTPGGYHIMLTELKQPLVAGQSFPLSLRFETAGTVETTVIVRPVGAANVGAGAAANVSAGAAAGMNEAGHDMQHMNMPDMK